MTPSLLCIPYHLDRNEPSLLDSLVSSHLASPSSSFNPLPDPLTCRISGTQADHYYRSFLCVRSIHQVHHRLHMVVNTQPQ
jgi:hypothetical protein